MRLSILAAMIFFIQLSAKGQTLSWDFPINRTHAGILLGNGVQGLMVWGDTTINITVGRAGFWDHRGGNDFAARTSFDTVKQLVRKKDDETLRRLFTYVPPQGQPARPQHLGGGVWRLRLPGDYRIQRGTLDLAKGIITIAVVDPKKKIIPLVLQQSVFDELAWIDLPGELQGKLKAEVLPMWEWNKEQLGARSIAAPESWQDKEIRGFIQSLPEDLPLAMAQRITSSRLMLSTHVGNNAKEAVISLLETKDLSRIKMRTAQWWKEYWSSVARIRIPDQLLQELYDYGLYKQACATPPHGLACTLQGVFMEEYQLPPWSNDYHFNINEQLIYTPALATNRSSHFKPLMQLIDSLLPVMRRNGRLFFKNDEAVMFPHAVDDRGQAIGNYWGGTIDHATTAWVAFLTWQYYQYSGDSSYLRKISYPLLNGAFQGFWSMMERDTLRGQYSLPVSVSPEYGSGLEGVGRNSSFQLAALHKILQVLPEIAKILELPVDRNWEDVRRHLPPYTIVNMPYGESSKNAPERIGLWEGKDLEISHRHHSHLAAIYPFQTIDTRDTGHKKILERSYWNWVHKGAGGWTGWCIPWASIIHNRMGNTEAAISWLHYWAENFVNEGRGTLHNSTRNGMSVFNEPLWVKEIGRRKNTEIMQLDAGFGAISAILDLLVQETPGGIYILPNRSWRWKNLSFERIRTAGGFLISAKVENNGVKMIRVRSETGNQIRLHHGLGNSYLLNGKVKEGEWFEMYVPKNTEVILSNKLIND